MVRRLHWLAVAVACCALSEEVRADDASKTSPSIVRVAVYHDSGVSDKVAELIDLLRERSELQVDSIQGEDIRAGKLNEYQVVLFPGGSGSREAASLEANGRHAVRSFVDRGGGFVGICAGAYLASADYDWSLRLLDAKVLDRKHWARGSGNVEVNLTEAGRQLLGAKNARETVLYWQGPLLAPADDPAIPDYESLGTFATEIAKNGAPAGVMIGTTAIARSIFGSGRVICFSPHPERTAEVQHFVPKAILWSAGR